MQFRQIDEEPVRAGNLSNSGAVYYLRWHDENEDKYVQITNIHGGPGVGNGTFSNLLFRLDGIGVASAYTGYSLVDGSKRTTKDNNMSGFLRAARDDVFLRIKKQKEADAL